MTNPLPVQVYRDHSGGRAVTPSIQITQDMINANAAISGDFNPVHVDPDFAAATPFGQTIAHGYIPMEPIFQLVQARLVVAVLPQGTGITLRYLRPCHPGDTIGIVVKTEGPEGLEFQCVNQRGEPVIEGAVRLVSGGGRADGCGGHDDRSGTAEAAGGEEPGQGVCGVRG